MTGMKARDRIRSLFDSYEEFGAEITGGDPIGFPGYLEQRADARSTTGEPEAVVTGVGTIEEMSVVAAVFEFGFLGGSMSEAVGTRLERAMARAGQMRRPFVCVTATGGARMQEGMAALAQMPRTVAASADLARMSVARISILANPTTGGVYAAFASLADIIIAESGATIGFAGPRVAQAMSGEALPERSHQAEAAFDAGLVDAVVDSAELRGTLATILRILEPSG